MFVYLGVFGLFASLSASYGQEASCQLTSTKAQGSCVSLNECASLLALLRPPRSRPADVLSILEKARCGLDGTTPKVCCAAEEPQLPTKLPTLPDVSNHRNLRLVNSANCGSAAGEKVFGGKKTDASDYPWMALIAYKQSNGSSEFRCGGTLISKRYVLTAAHCVTGLEAEVRLGVRLGEHDLSTDPHCEYDGEDEDPGCPRKYDFEVESFVPHKEYSRSKLQNDIALIRLSTDVDFRPVNVRPICLPIGSAGMLLSVGNLENPQAIITGWGTTESGQRSQVLLQATLPIMPNHECARVYQDYHVDIWFKQMCAGGGVDHADSCRGDSGGPLQAQGIVDDHPKIIQYGVVSFGPKSCGIKGVPGVYTRVAYYTDWILDSMTD